MSGAAGADLLDAVRATGLLEPGRPALVLVSGGQDSTALLDCAARLLGAAGVRALHVHHGLRGDAGEDEAACRRLCAELEVPLEVARPRRPPGPGNVQAWARAARYAAAEGLAAPRDALVLTGHTASDQAETVLYRLAASPGRRALLGMPAADGRLRRPLLGVTRAATAAHCRARGLRWHEDPSNREHDYARTRVRETLLPALREVHPEAERNVLRTVEALNEEAAVLDELVAGVIRGRREVPLDELRAAPPALARLVLRSLAEAAAGRLAPEAARRAGELLALGEGRGLDLGRALRGEVAGGALRFRVGPA